MTIRGVFILAVFALLFSGCIVVEKPAQLSSSSQTNVPFIVSLQAFPPASVYFGNHIRLYASVMNPAQRAAAEIFCWTESGVETNCETLTLAPGETRTLSHSVQPASMGEAKVGFGSQFKLISVVPFPILGTWVNGTDLDARLANWTMEPVNQSGYVNAKAEFQIRFHNETRKLQVSAIALLVHQSSTEVPFPGHFEVISKSVNFTSMYPERVRETEIRVGLVVSTFIPPDCRPDGSCVGRATSSSHLSESYYPDDDMYWWNLR
ncbi:MAG: hypothetical protein AABX89_05765 [Candidatus Thermoplasmatota archaeon]